MNLADLSATQLRQAASIKEQIEELQKELTRILGTGTPAATAPAKPKKRRMSKAAKAKLSAKLREIWAKRKAAKRPTTVAQQPKRKKRKMSAAAKKKLSDFQKARWAKIKAAKKK